MDSSVSRRAFAKPAMPARIMISAMLLCAACGLQAHPRSVGTGGHPAAGAGHTSESGGKPSGGTTETGGSSGNATGGGGQSTANGGQTTAGGGADSGGQTVSSGSGGQTSASGGQSAASGGQTTGSGGQSARSGGTTGNGGQTSGSGGVTSSGGKTGGAGGGATGGSSSSSSTASGAGVTINGKFVPKEKAVVFIHFGHSNMRGQATTPTSLKPYFYNTVDGLWSFKGSFTLAKEPTAPEGSYTYAGPGMAILQSAKAALASGSDVQFISVGFGIGSKTTVDYQKSGNYYPIFMGWAGQLKGNVTFGAIVVMLGLTDGEHLASNLIPGFPTRMAQIISDIRADLGEPNLPVLFCDYEMGATGTFLPTGTIGTQMIPLIHQLPTLVSKLVLVPTDNLEMQDDHHFDMQGHKDWAARVISLMQSNNWFPWK